MEEPPLTTEITEAELHAWADGQLDASREPAVLIWLLAHPEDAHRVAAWRSQAQALRQHLRQMTLEEAKPALTAALRWRLWRHHGRRRGGFALAAAVLLVIGILVGRGSAPGEMLGAPFHASASDFVHDAVIAHTAFTPEQRHPVEVTTDESSHLLQWLSRRLGAPIKAPALEAQGYRLLGGRLLPGNDAPRAQFMYENSEGERLTLYIAVFAPDRASAPVAFRSAHQGKLQVFYWVDERFGYALSGSTSAREWAEITQAVYHQLEP